VGRSEDEEKKCKSGRVSKCKTLAYGALIEDGKREGKNNAETLRLAEIR
jgi:hypothetical protein